MPNKTIKEGTVPLNKTEEYETAKRIIEKSSKINVEAILKKHFSDGGLPSPYQINKIKAAMKEAVELALDKAAERVTIIRHTLINDTDASVNKDSILEIKEEFNYE